MTYTIYTETYKMQSEKKILTVGDLKKRLQELPDDLPIVYSVDDEGNRYEQVRYLPSIGRGLLKRMEGECVCIN